MKLLLFRGLVNSELIQGFTLVDLKLSSIKKLRGTNIILKIIKFIKNNWNHTFVEPQDLLIHDRSNHHHDKIPNNKNHINILSNQKNKNHIHKKTIILNQKFIKILFNIYFLIFMKLNNSFILNCNKNGIIRNIQANIHISELNSNHQVIKFINSQVIIASKKYIRLVVMF